MYFFFSFLLLCRHYNIVFSFFMLQLEAQVIFNPDKYLGNYNVNITLFNLGFKYLHNKNATKVTYCSYKDFLGLKCTSKN